MAFTPSTLALGVDTIAGGSLRVHFYSTSDDASTVTAANYFTRGARYGLRVGDVIIVTGDAGTFMVEVDEVTSTAASASMLDETIVSPEHFGAVYDYDPADRLAASDNTAAFNAFFDYVRTISAGATLTPPKLTLGKGRALIAGSVDATGIDSEFVLSIDGAGATIVGRGAGNVTLDFTGSRWIKMDNLFIYGESEDPPAIGLMIARAVPGGDGDGDNASDWTLQNCRTYGKFRFAAYVNLGAENQVEIGNTWRNDLDPATDSAMIAAADGYVYGAAYLSRWLYRSIVQSDYLTINHTSANISFLHQVRIGVRYMVKTGGFGLLVTGGRDHTWIGCYAWRGIRFLADNLAVIGRRMDIHVEKGAGAATEPDAWMTIEAMPNEDAPGTYHTDTVTFHDATFFEAAANHQVAFFDISDANLASVVFKGGKIAIGDATDAAENSLFSDPDKVTLDCDVVLEDDDKVWQPDLGMPNGRRIFGSTVIQSPYVTRGIVLPETAELMQFMGSDAPAWAKTQAYDTAISDLKDAGVWARMGVLWVLAGPTLSASLLDIRYPSRPRATATGGTFTAWTGYAGNGTTAYIDTGLTLTDIPGWAQNDAHAGVFIATGSGTATDTVVGAASGSVLLTLIPRNGSGDSSGRINASANVGWESAVADRTGHFGLSRSASGTFTGYSDGTARLSPASTSEAPSGQTGNVTLLRSGATYVDDQVFAFHAGAGMTAGQWSDCYTILNALKTALAA